MITIKGVTETEIIVKKSRFLGLACRVSDEAAAQQALEDLSRRDGNHVKVVLDC